MSERWETVATPGTSPSRGPHTGLVLLLAFLVSLVGAGTIHVVLGAVQPKAAPVAADEAQARVVVPDLVGLTVQGARRRADGDRLLLHVVGEAPAGRTDGLRVATQRPLAGSLVRVDDAIEVGLVASDAPALLATAPAAEPAAEATAAPSAMLAAEEARRREVAAVTAPAERAPQVAAAPATPAPAAARPVTTEARPAPAAAAAAAAPDDGAPEMVKVPYLGRTTEEDAQRRLEAAGFKVRTSTVFSPSVPTGRVILTRPAAGEEAALGTSILLFLAE